MKHFARLPARRLLAGLALLLGTNLAQAQYVWIDAKGLRQYSDRPPPPSTPASKILKTPGRQPLPVREAAQIAPAPAPPQGLPTLAEREADYRKRAKDQAERERKETEERRRKAELAEHCDSARAAKAQLESDVRIADMNRDGEPTFLSDEERARRLARANRLLDDCR